MIFMKALINAIQKKIKLLIVFNDKIAGILSNKKLHSVVTVSYIKQKKKNEKYFSIYCLYHTISFCCTKKYYTKICALLYYENSKQARASTNCNQ